MRRLFRMLGTVFKNMDRGLLFFTTLITIFGLLSIVSASTRESVVTYNLTLYHYFWQHLIMIGIAVFASVIILLVPTKYYRIFGPLVFGVAFLMVIATAFNGEAVRGNNNWLELFGFKFQPSEIAQPAMIIVLAVLFETFYKKIRNIKDSNRYTQIGIIGITAIIFPLFIYYIQGDLGQVLLILSIAGCMLLVSPLLRIDKFRLGSVMAFLLMIILVISLATGNQLSDSQSSRFNRFWDPCSNYSEGSGYQVCNSFIAINNGGLFGMGIGNSQQKYSYIPDPHTDMIFAVIAEENGLLKSGFIFLVYIFILNRLFSIASTAATISGKYIAFGMAVYIFVHIFINLGGLFGLIPLTGVPLPFLSYGGTFTICLIASLAVVQRIHIESRLARAK